MRAVLRRRRCRNNSVSSFLFTGCQLLIIAAPINSICAKKLIIPSVDVCSSKTDRSEKTSASVDLLGIVLADSFDVEISGTFATGIKYFLLKTPLSNFRMVTEKFSEEENRSITSSDSRKLKYFKFFSLKMSWCKPYICEKYLAGVKQSVSVCNK